MLFFYGLADFIQWLVVVYYDSTVHYRVCSPSRTKKSHDLFLSGTEHLLRFLLFPFFSFCKPRTEAACLHSKLQSILPSGKKHVFLHQHARTIAIFVVDAPVLLPGQPNRAWCASRTNVQGGRLKEQFMKS